MRNTIYLVRHAEAQSNTNFHHIGEAHLTEDGIDQAQRLAKRFDGKNIDNIYVSEILRAKSTAEEISKVVGKTSIELGFLKERKGAYSGDMLFVPEESFSDMKTRLIEAKQFLENLPGSSVVVVSHAIFIKNLLADIMTGGFENESVMSKIEDVLVIDNATISKIVFNKEKEKWRIMSLNCPV